MGREAHVITIIIIFMFIFSWLAVVFVVQDEKEALRALGWEVLESDGLMDADLTLPRGGQGPSGSSGVRSSMRVVYFMPHCPVSLYSRVVAHAWDKGLMDVVIIGNR